jgi:hypothetical protein
MINDPIEYLKKVFCLHYPNLSFYLIGSLAKRPADIKRVGANTFIVKNDVDLVVFFNGSITLSEKLKIHNFIETVFPGVPIDLIFYKKSKPVPNTIFWQDFKCFARKISGSEIELRLNQSEMIKNEWFTCLRTRLFTLYSYFDLLDEPEKQAKYNYQISKLFLSGLDLLSLYFDKYESDFDLRLSNVSSSLSQAVEDDLKLSMLHLTGHKKICYEQSRVKRAVDFYFLCLGLNIGKNKSLKCFADLMKFKVFWMLLKNSCGIKAFIRLIIDFIELRKELIAGDLVVEAIKAGKSLNKKEKRYLAAVRKSRYKF